MSKALVVGIDYYAHANCLNGCVNDATKISSLLKRHGDDTINFDVKTLVSVNASSPIDSKTLRDQIIELFKTNGNALLYFSGHGHIEKTGGYLITSECEEGNEGIPMADILK